MIFVFIFLGILAIGLICGGIEVFAAGKFKGGGQR